MDLGIDDIPYPVSDTSVTKILPSIRKYGQYHRPIAHPIFLWPNVPNTCETRMTKKTSFQTDIRPLFAECDIQSMSKAFHLGSYDDVKKHAAAMYDRIRGIGGAVMPPPPPKGEGPWRLSRIELFAKWMTAGFQPRPAERAQT